MTRLVTQPLNTLRLIQRTFAAGLRAVQDETRALLKLTGSCINYVEAIF